MSVPEITGYNINETLDDQTITADVSKKGYAEALQLALKGASLELKVRIATIIQEDLDTRARQGDNIRALFKDSKGVFIGPKELGLDRKIPPIQFTEEFLKSEHPLRNGKRIMDSCVLAFDDKTNIWHLVELSVIPGSLGSEKSERPIKGLSGDDADKLVKDVKVNGVSLSAPKDSSAFQRIINKVIEIKYKAGIRGNDRPFCTIYARTADTERAEPGCRVVVGNPLHLETHMQTNIPANHTDFNIGLGGEWYVEEE